jgi:purine-nucleoside phosphorylase
MTDIEPLAPPRPSAEEAASELARRTGALTHDVAVVLGSGWGPAADAFGPPVA